MIREKKLILVVDDTEATRYAVARTLQKEGYDIIQAENGTRALEMVEKSRPDLVTLDIHLPDILGFEVCRRIKSNPLTAHIPVLQVSASFVLSKDKIQGLEGGADSYLTHPFEPPVLVATVKALLRSRQLNENLRVAEERIRVAVKNAPITIFTTDKKCRINWICNPPFSLEAKAFLGHTFQDAFSGAEAATIERIQQEVLTTGLGQRLTTQIMQLKEAVWFDVTIEPFLDTDGELIGLTVSFFDVTLRMLAEDAQKRAYDAAEFANQAKSRFLANMSHEIRTPIGIIQGFAELASAPGLAQDERDEYLKIVRRNAGNLSLLIGDILDLAKIESGKLELEVIPFALTDMVRDIVDGMRLVASEKGIELKFNASADFPSHIRADSTKIRQVLLNLINNALKFTNSGSIEIQARVTDSDNRSLKILEFDVVDTGIGMAAEEQTRVFEAFVQADSSTTRKFGGTGLGLDLSKKLSQAMGGDLYLRRSSKGKGSTFTFYFKAEEIPMTVSREQASLKHIEQKPFEQRLLGMNILLVEDALDNQRLFSLYLTRAGATVTVAGDGERGVKRAMESAFEVILMDLQMPILDGYSATAELRAKGYKGTIIALSAHAIKEEKDRAIENGFDDYLTKPIESELLVSTLQQYQSK